MTDTELVRIYVNAYERALAEASGSDLYKELYARFAARDAVGPEGYEIVQLADKVHDRK
jgi:hypothetical protein